MTVCSDGDPAVAEAGLREYAQVVASRDQRVLAAIAAGLSKNRVHLLTGIARTTIDRIMDGDRAAD